MFSYIKGKAPAVAFLHPAGLQVQYGNFNPKRTMKAAAAALCGDISTDLEATGKIIVEFALTKLPEILISPMQDKSK